MQCSMTTTSVWFTRVLHNVFFTFVSFKRTTVIINYQQVVVSSMFKYISCQLLSSPAGCITNGHSLPGFLSLVLCTVAMISYHFYTLCIHAGPMKSSRCPVFCITSSEVSSWIFSASWCILIGVSVSLSFCTCSFSKSPLGLFPFWKSLVVKGTSFCAAQCELIISFKGLTALSVLVSPFSNSCVLQIW